MSDKQYRIITPGKIKRITWENNQWFAFYDQADEPIAPDCLCIDCEAGVFLVEVSRSRIYHGVGYVIDGVKTTRDAEHPIVIMDETAIAPCYAAAYATHFSSTIESARSDNPIRASEPEIGQEIPLLSPAQAREFFRTYIDDFQPGENRKYILADSTVLSLDESRDLSL